MEPNISHPGSYRVGRISESKQVETSRLKAQVDLFWDKEIKIYRQAGLSDGMMVVEFGSGPGFVLEKLIEDLPSSTIIGVEVDLQLIDYCCKYFGRERRCHLLQSSISGCGLASNIFDFAVVRLVLEHLAEPQKAVREVFRVLKPGGKAVFVDNDFGFHIMTSPDADKLRDLYDAYTNARIAEGGNPKIGRDLPNLLRSGRFVNIDLDVIPAHSELVGDTAFTKSEGLGIPAKLVRDGYLSSKSLAEIAVQWRNVIAEKGHTIYRQLFVCTGQKAKTSECEANKPERRSSESPKPLSKKSHGSERTPCFASVFSLREYILSICNESLNRALEIRINDEDDGSQIMELHGADASFIELGLNSMRSVEYIDMLNRCLNINLGVEAVFDYQNVSELSGYIISTYPEICQDLFDKEKERQKARPSHKNISIEKAPSASGKNEAFRKNTPIQKECAINDIAVIGMSGRFPGAENVDQYWENLLSGCCSIVEINRDGWDLSEFYDSDATAINRSISKWGGLLDCIDKFDPLFFRISPSEAEMMDPQQRLMLEEGFKTFENAGYPIEQLEGKRIGVFIGARTSDYMSLASTYEPFNAQMFLGNDISILAARIAYYCNLKGPCITVDTACSSSLTALHLACESLRRGEAEMALAGGVFLMPTPQFYFLASKTGMLSPDGSCKTFDNNANGIVPGEAICAVLLKPLQNALEDRDIIYGVIKGSAVNQDGKTKGITAPSALSQQRLIEQAIRNAGINPQHIGYVETHGTGTKLGDPIEFKALTRAFSQTLNKKQSCLIGSHKPNIGHTIVAAGIAGLIKILLAIKHHLIPPTIGLNRINQHIDINNSPFSINTEAVTWEPMDGIPLTAGISSFGFSGTNCHMVLEAPPNCSSVDPMPYSGSYLMPLSAKTPAACIDLARDLRKYLERTKQDPIISDVAYTLQTGRNHFSCRRAMVVGDIREFCQKLAEIENGKESWDHTFDAIKTRHFPQHHPATALVGKLARNVARFDGRSQSELVKDLNQLADLYVKGLSIPWSGLYQDAREPQRITLPAYPFQGQSCWVNRVDDALQVRAVQKAVAQRPHPLIDRNISNLDICQYEKAVPPGSLFFTDHRFMGEELMPGAAGVEMARAAGELAEQRKVTRIKDLIWLRPIHRSDNSLLIKIKQIETNHRAAFEVVRSGNPEDENDAVKISGTLHFDNAETVKARIPTPLDVHAIVARLPQAMSKKACYALFQRLGFDYGPAFTTIERCHTDGATAIAFLRKPEIWNKKPDSYQLHPALLDGAFQTVLCLHAHKEPPSEVKIPFRLGELTLYHALPESCYVYATVTSSPQHMSKKTARYNLTIADESGNVAAVIHDFSIRPLNKTTGTATEKHESAVEPAHFFKPMWLSAPLAPHSATLRPETSSGSILIITADEALREAFINQIQQAGKVPVIVTAAGEDFRAEGPCDYVIDPYNPEHIEALLQTLEKQSSFPKTVYYALTEGSQLTSTDTSGCASAPIYPLLYLCQSLARRKIKNKTILIHSFISANNQHDAWHWAVAGFSKTLRFENPNLFLKTVAIKNNSSDDNAIGVDTYSRILLREVFADDQSDHLEIRYQGKERHIRTFAEYLPEENAAFHSVLKSAAVYLITGGTGKLGVIFAEYLAREVGARVVMVSRNPISDEQWERVFSRLGPTVDHMRADVSDFEQVRALVTAVREKHGQIRGVFHCAGVLNDGLFFNKQAQDAERVLAPKILGVLNLDRATRKDPIDLFVLFSSVAAVMGNPGQCDYAYANSFMDAYAEYREKLRRLGQRHGVTLAINWPLWQEGGMQVDETDTRMILKRTGMRAMETHTGLTAFKTAVNSGLHQLVIAVGQKEKLMNALNSRNMASGKRREVLPDENTSEIGSMDMEEKRRTDATAALTQICAELLKVDQKDIDPDADLEDYGVDSIIMMNMLNRIEALWGITLEPNAVIENPTITGLGQYLIDNEMVDSACSNATQKETADACENAATALHPQVFEPAGTIPSPSLLSEEETKSTTRLRPPGDPIAVIAVSCRFPGADTPESFHNNLIQARNLVSQPPAERLRLHQAYGEQSQGHYNKTYSVWGGYINDIERFDPGCFGITEREALLMDPQHRILLELTQHVLDRAGYRKEEMDGTKTGVFIGGGESNYIKGHMHRIAQQDFKYMLVNALQNMMAGRISNTFNFRGPSQTIDTACSSSLVAVHLACASLRNRECEAALAGGIELLFNPFLHIGFGHTGALSEDGTAYVFDQRAKGIVLGEGAGLVMLKRLDDALAHGDQILTVICGSAVNNDGRTMGVTVPSMEGQKAVIEQALAVSNIEVDQIGCLEAHGTGTLLGDPIEIKAATEVYRQYTSKTGFCAVGSVKSNIGHLLRAAGVAGLIKLVLAIQFRKIPPTINCTKPHPRFGFEQSPFFPVTQQMAWATNGHRRAAAISSFGFGGTNCHMILQESPLENARGVCCKRKPFPPTLFQRKPYWLGDDIKISGEKNNPFDKQFYAALLKDLENGAIDTTRGLELVRKKESAFQEPHDETTSVVKKYA